MRGRAGLILLLACAAGAQEDQESRQVARLIQQAKGHADSAKESWTGFVFQADEIADKDLETIVGTYEKAIDVYQKVLEIRDEPGVDSAILGLARRVTQLRFVLMSREMRRKAATAPKPPPQEKPEEEEKPAAPPPAPETEEAEAEETAAPARVELPKLEESPAQRRRGIQDARNFLMNNYFAGQKFTSIVSRCATCNGRGRKPTGHLDERRRVVTVACPACRETGYHLDVPAARRSHWLVQSPLYRADPSNRAVWEQTLAAWREDPRTIAEFLTSVRILDVDYHGVWAELTWVEKGTTPDRKKFERKRKEKVIRAGRLWFFYDEKFDKDFFAPPEPE